MLHCCIDACWFLTIELIPLEKDRNWINMGTILRSSKPEQNPLEPAEKTQDSASQL